MRKLILVLFVICIFGVFSAMAQATGNTSNPAQSSSSNSQQQTGNGNQPSENNTGMASSSAQASSSGSQQTLEGCLVREQTAYYIQPGNGQRMEIASNNPQDLDSRIGQEVRVTGSQQSNSASSSSGNSPYSSASSSTPENPGTGTSGSGGSVASNQAGSTGSMNSSQSSASDNTTSQANSGQTLFVANVETVSSTCPASTQGSSQQRPPQ